MKKSSKSSGLFDLLVLRPCWELRKSESGLLVLQLVKPKEESSTSKNATSLVVQHAPPKLWDALFTMMVCTDEDPHVGCMYVPNFHDAGRGYKIRLRDPKEILQVLKGLNGVNKESGLVLCGAGDIASISPHINALVEDPPPCSSPPVTWRMWGEYGTLMACMAGKGDSPVYCSIAEKLKPRGQTKTNIYEAYKSRLEALASMEAELLTGSPTISTDPAGETKYGQLYRYWRKDESLPRLIHHLDTRLPVLEPWCATMCERYGMSKFFGSEILWIGVWVRCIPGTEGHATAKNMPLKLLDDLIHALNFLRDRFEYPFGLLLFGDRSDLVGNLQGGSSAGKKIRETKLVDYLSKACKGLPIVDFREMQDLKELNKKGCLPEVIVGRESTVPTATLLETCETAKSGAYLLTYNQMLFYRYLQSKIKIPCMFGPEAGNLDNFGYSGIPVISVDLNDPVLHMEWSTLTDRIGHYSLLSDIWTLLNGYYDDDVWQLEFRRYLCGALYYRCQRMHGK